VTIARLRTAASCRHFICNPATSQMALCQRLYVKRLASSRFIIVALVLAALVGIGAGLRLHSGWVTNTKNGILILRSGKPIS
jgi:hypothetical protein